MSLSSPACMRNVGPLGGPCPCCGHLVFGGPPGSFEICPVCFWEDDALHLEFATTLSGGANGITLAEAQRNFAELGACEAASVRSVRPPLAGEPRDPLWRPVDPGRDAFPAWDSGERAPEHDETLYYWRPGLLAHPILHPRIHMILAIDEGTTGVTCLVIDVEGRVRGRGYSEFAQHFPRPGWVEHDTEEIWETTRRVAAAAVQDAGMKMDGLAGIGITNQRETVVLWDRATGRPLHRALVWQDGRTAQACRALKEAGHEEDVRARTGLVIDPYFSGTKLSWLLDNVPDARRRAEAGELAAGTIDSWLVWKMTGGAHHLTDPTNASRTLLYALDSGAWDPAMLELFGVPAAVLPEVRGSSEVYGTTQGDALGAEIPIAGIAGDQQAALFGHGCTTAGEGKNTYGTGAFLLVNTGTERVASKHGMLTTAACGPRGERAFALEGSIFIAGAAVQWLRDGLGIVEQAEETDALARSLESNDGVYFVPAFTGLGAPHWEPRARGTLFGLTRGSTRAHLARAALEAMAFSTADVVEAMQADAGLTLPELRVDGGATSNDWLMQYQADVLGVPVRRPLMVEMTARGAAGLAGLATGVWRTPEEFAGARPEETVFTPAADDAARGEWQRGWRRAVGAVRAWATEEQS